MTGGGAALDIAARADIERLVVDFYRDAAVDDLLGPVFERAGVDWPSHIDKLTDFWAWQLLGLRGYEGNPLKAHQPLHDDRPLTEAQFARWLELFHATVDCDFAGPVAEAAKQRATRMARAMRRLLEGHAEAGTNPTEAMWPAKVPGTAGQPAR